VKNSQFNNENSNKKTNEERKNQYAVGSKEDLEYDSEDGDGEDDEYDSEEGNNEDDYDSE
jgi:hypothetical protein